MAAAQCITPENMKKGDKYEYSVRLFRGSPFIKTGGLADVAGSLPKKLAEMGHDVKVILPLYEGVAQQYREKMKLLCHWNCRVAWRTPYCGILELREDNISYLFVDNEYYFKRAEVYGHYDDGERFTFSPVPSSRRRPTWTGTRTSSTATTGRPPWCPFTSWRSGNGSGSCGKQERVHHPQYRVPGALRRPGAGGPAGFEPRVYE